MLDLALAYLRYDPLVRIHIGPLSISPPGVGIGIIFGKVIESVTRQPEMRDEITSIQWLGFALTEACFFYGLVAGLIARELGLDLYRVDLESILPSGGDAGVTWGTDLDRSVYQPSRGVGGGSFALRRLARGASSGGAREERYHNRTDQRHDSRSRHAPSRTIRHFRQLGSRERSLDPSTLKVFDERQAIVPEDELRTLLRSGQRTIEVPGNGDIRHQPESAARNQRRDQGARHSDADRERHRTPASPGSGESEQTDSRTEGHGGKQAPPPVPARKIRNTLGGRHVRTSAPLRCESQRSMKKSIAASTRRASPSSRRGMPAWSAVDTRAGRSCPVAMRRDCGFVGASVEGSGQICAMSAGKDASTGGGPNAGARMMRPIPSRCTITSSGVAPACRSAVLPDGLRRPPTEALRRTSPSRAPLMMVQNRRARRSIHRGRLPPP